MHKPPMMKPRPLALAVAVAVGALPGGASAAAGRIQFAWGQVSVEQSGGESTKVKRGDKIEPGDTIVTERGRAQIKFTDGSYVSLQPKTTFKVEEYKYGGAEDGSERSFMSLFRGGLRAISGAIGRSNRDSYRLNTPVGTIGIRGTEYLVMLEGSGAIITVGDGAIAMINDAGEVVLVNGQTGRIVDRNSLPIIVDGKAVVPPPPKDTRDDPEAGEPQQDDDEFLISVTDDDGIPSDTLGRLTVNDGNGGEMTPPPEEMTPPPEEMPPPPEEMTPPPEEMTPPPEEMPPPPEEMPPPPEEMPPPPEEMPPPPEEMPPPILKLESGSGFTVAYTFFDSFGSPRNQKDDDSDATFVDGQLTQWVADGGEGPSSDIGPLMLVEAGSDAWIGWGRWSNPGGSNMFTVNGNNEQFNNANQSLHYVTGRPTDLMALAAAGETMARYSVQSFTTPTDANGATGQFLGATFAADITNQRVDGTVAARMATTDYNLDFFGVNAPSGSFSNSANVNSPNGGCSSGCSGFVSGLVAGPAAQRAGFVYHIGDSGFQDIFGAVTFLNDPAGPLPPD